MPPKSKSAKGGGEIKVAKRSDTKRTGPSRQNSRSKTNEGTIRDSNRDTTKASQDRSRATSRDISRQASRESSLERNQDAGPMSHQEPGSEPTCDANHENTRGSDELANGEASIQRMQQRVPSGISPRKVSEGLKQLPHAAYQFVRESYLMLDSDGTGSVSRGTLRELLGSIGMHHVSNETLDAMLERTGEPITFAGYLTVMGDLLADLPPREEMDLMLEAFQNKDGSFDEREMQRGLLAEGLTQAEIDQVIQKFSKPTRKGDQFDHKAFANTMSV